MSHMRTGEVIAGRYELEERAGEGGMGVVWRAYDRELRRVVALKHATTGGILREGRVGAGLQHPNIISVYDSVMADGERWLVLEYLPSRNLAEVVKADGPLSPDRAALVGARIAAALAAMHAAKMVHRDVTPANVLVTEDGTAKLADLGITIWANVTETGEARAAGTPGFMAPEVVAGHVATPASDVYSLGATLSAAVEGGAPGAALTGVLSRLVDPEPKRRPTAEEAGQLLDEVGRPHRSSGKRVLVAAAATVLVGVVVGAVVVFTRPATPLSGVELVGEPRTADPCALVDENTLQHFGPTKVDRDYGDFNQCDVLVAFGDDEDATVQAAVRLDTGPDDTTGETLPSVDAAREIIEAPAAESPDCRRLLLLPERYRVVVSARYVDQRTPAPCTVADEMFAAARGRLGEVPLPRRDATLDPLMRDGSLAGVDACGLLDTADLTPLLGAGATEPEAGFAGWNCAWFSPGGNRRVLVAFGRVDPPVPEDGIPARFAGRDGYVQPEGWGDNDCLAAVRFATYDSTDEGGRKVEEVYVFVRDDQPPAQRCDTARTLATAAAQRLPGNT